MKITKERRKSYVWFVLALALIFILSIVVIKKYFDLQKDYYKSLQRQSISEERF